MSQQTFLRIFFCSVLMTGILSAGVLYHSASALQPSDHLKEAISQIQKILKDESLSAEDIKVRVNEYVGNLFDFHEMGKLALGKHWDLNPSKQEEFVYAFSGFLKRLYFSHMDKLKSATITILSESTGVSKSQVKIELYARAAYEYELDINMHRIQGNWMIYDVSVGGISLVQNFRAQFARKLKHGSIDDLIKEIQGKKNT